MKQYPHLSMFRQTIASAAICLVALSSQPMPVVAQSAQTLRFTAQIPTAPSSLPLYELHAATAPRAIVDQLLVTQRATPFHLESTHLVQAPSLLVSRDAVSNNLRAYIDPTTNESVVLPNLAKIIPKISSIHPSMIASTLFKRSDVLPHDLTSYRLGSEIAIQGAATAKPHGGVAHVVSATSTHFTFVSALRYASGYPVYGIGSRATFAIGPDGSVQGLLRRWKSASRSGSITTSIAGDRVRAAIRAQLAPFLAHNVVTVDQVKLAYYDGNAQFLQPVYRFTAVLHPVSGPAADARIAGFVALGQTREALPLLVLKSSFSPTTPNERNVPQLQSGGIGGTTISFGEYANRDTTLNGMADQFNTGLTKHSSSALPQIVRTQYYYAQPWEVVGSSSKYFLNAVNIAYTQPHGDWYINTTYSNYADEWDVRNIGTGGNPGFGAAAGGKLATWIIDSCEVVPSVYDMSIATGNGANAFNAWWPVFQGLHNVIGFRTEMWLYDGLNTPFGIAAQLGGDVNAAWFQEIAADPAYNDGYTYYDSHINQNVHMGRASTFIDARDLGHSIYDVKAQSASTTLWNFWMGN